jgi:hypothetical protein
LTDLTHLANFSRVSIFIDNYFWELMHAILRKSVHFAREKCSKFKVCIWSIIHFYFEELYISDCWFELSNSSMKKQIRYRMGCRLRGEMNSKIWAQYLISIFKIEIKCILNLSRYNKTWENLLKKHPTDTLFRTDTLLLKGYRMALFFKGHWLTIQSLQINMQNSKLLP